MTADANKAVIREFTRIFKNEHRQEDVDHLFHSDFRHNFRQELPDGLEGFKTIGRIMNGTFPDVCVTEEDLVAGEGKVIERSTARGTHQGDLLGVPATGRRVKWSEIHIYELKGGQIIQHWVEWSDKELFETLAQA